MFNVKPKRILVEQLLSSWQKHQRSIFLLLSELPEEALSASLSAEGEGNIAQQFWHLHKVRMHYLESFMKKQELRATKDWGEQNNKANIERALEESGRILYQYLNFSIKEKKARVESFKDGIIGFFTYLISHEAHHKGTILLTAKYSGYTLNEQLQSGIWDWDKL